MQRLDQFMTGDDVELLQPPYTSWWLTAASRRQGRMRDKGRLRRATTVSDVLLQQCERRFGTWLHEMLAKHSEAA